MIGLGLNAQSNLLFKTDFEGTVALSDLTPVHTSGRTDGTHFFSGSSLGYTLPSDGQLGMGTTNNGIHNIYGTTPSNTYVALDTTTGHDGNSTTALHTKVITNTGVNQLPWQFNNSTSNPDEIYMKYWQKVESTFLDGSAGESRFMWEYKTQNLDGQNQNGSRLLIVARKSNSTYWWTMALDAYTSPGVNEIIWVSESDPVTMIKDGDGGANNDWF